MMGVYMVPTFIVVFLFSRFGKNLDFESVAQDATVCALLLGGAVIIAIAAYIIYFISLGIYRRKESLRKPPVLAGGFSLDPKIPYHTNSCSSRNLSYSNEMVSI